MQNAKPSFGYRCVGLRMKISVVTISFNQAQFIEQAIRSVLSQDYPDVEYIIVDAGSTDGSRDIIQKYRDRLATIIFEPDDGPADGLNKGFLKATGDIFYYLNADDLLLPGALQIVANRFANLPHLDVIYGNGLVLDRQGQVVKQIFCSKWNLRSYMFGTVSVVQQATFFRSAAYKKAGGFNTNNRTCWDYELLADLAVSDCSIKQVPEFFGAIRIYDESITGSGRFQQAIFKDLARIRQRVLGRDPGWTDKFIFIYFRFIKNIMEPVVVFKKIQDAIHPLFKKSLSK